ncbi:MAG: histone deacetylase [Planctomycetota bacterium]
MPHFFYNPAFLTHDTGQHPENAGRLRAMIERLTETGMLEKLPQPEFDPAGNEAIARVHTDGMVAQVRGLAEAGGGQIDADTVVCPTSFDVARLAAGAACEATRQVVSGQAKTALVAARPPGHHATAGTAMGFCLLNHVAIAAQFAISELGLDRVLIVDWDVHHGNGTQDIFYRDEQVGFFSAHRYPFYPGSGAGDETGAAAGLGATRNLPVRFGTSRDRYLAWFGRELTDFADKLRPQLVLLSAGFDAHRTDPVGSLGLETEDFGDLTRLVLDVADTHAGGRVVSLLEGGYNPAALAECVELHLAELGEWEAERAR